jgi:hypothetical protein
MVKCGAAVAMGGGCAVDRRGDAKQTSCATVKVAAHLAVVVVDAGLVTQGAQHRVVKRTGGFEVVNA